MANILHISASINGTDSVSRKLGAILAEGFAAKAGQEVVVRDLSRLDPPLLSAERFAANGTPASERDEAQARLAELADTLIAELAAAETIVISAPIHNFGVPASLKAWADLVARAGTTFAYTANGPQGLLKGKTAYLAVSSGGTPVGSDADHMTSWLTFFLSFIGIEVAQVIAADGIMGEDGERKIAEAREQATRLAA